MWDLVGNPEDRFSHNEAHLCVEDGNLVLSVPVPGQCLPFTFLVSTQLKIGRGFIL